ncbi:YdgA family protein [Deinococcus sp.]|uniref:YdgA family protein n=1 Tax=Deinococcus sp. TaxID=47478 RepID=UPI0025DD6DA5|nr:YdgA family protein [Deinococcus sp.]
MTQVRRPTPVRKRSPLPALGIGALLLVGGLAGGTAYIGSQTVTAQEDLAKNIKTAVEATGYAQVKSSTYDRGFMNSTQTMNIVLGLKGESKPVGLTLINHIQHGPLPGFKAVGQAVIDSEVKFTDAALQTKFEAALKGQKPTIRTVVGLGGATSSQIEVPAGSLTEQGTTVSWQALMGDVQNAGLTGSADLSWPEFKVVGDGVNMTISGVSVKGNTVKQSLSDPLAVGDQTLRIGSIRVAGSSGGQAGTVSIKDMALVSKSSVMGGFYNGALSYDIGQADIDSPGAVAQSFKNAQLRLSMNHLSREPLVRLLALVNSLNEKNRAAGSSAASGLASLSAAQRKAATDDALALLKAQPVLSVDRLSLVRPEGELVLSARAEIPGAAKLNAESVQMLTQAPALGVGMLKLQAQFKGPDAALRGLLGTIAPSVTSSLDGLIQAGFLKKQGRDLVSDLSLNEGKPTINGQAMGQ